MAVGESESKRLLPGRKYAVLIRSAARKAFFSVPLMFNVAFPRPKKVYARLERNTITVTWDFPLTSSKTHFLIFVESLYDRLRAVQVRLHTCTLKMDASELSDKLDVMVYAISGDDVRSDPSTATIISHPLNKSAETTSPGMETHRWALYYSAAMRGDTEVMEALVEAETGVNIKNDNGQMALHLAATIGDTEVVKALVEAGTDMNMKGLNGKTSLHLAAGRGYTELVKALLEMGADVNIRDDDGQVALHQAAERGEIEVVIALLEVGTDINMEDCNRMTALLLAAGKGYIEVAKALLEAGADLNAKDFNGKKALNLAAEGEHTDVVRLLEAWADINTPDRDHIRKVRFRWSGSITESGSWDLAEESLALMSIPSADPHGLRQNSVIERVRLGSVARLVDDYWGPLGRKVLDAFMKLLKRVLAEQNVTEKIFSDYPKSEEISIYLHATRSDIFLVGCTRAMKWQAVVSCLKWLISIVGVPSGLKIRQIVDVSSATGDTHENPISSNFGEIPGKFVEAEVSNTYELREASISSNDKSSSLCWVNLIRDGYIGIHDGCHYNVSSVSAEEWVGKGLKVSFDILVSIAGINLVLQVGGGLILAGFQTALIPTERLTNGSVQWHFLSALDYPGEPFRWFHQRPNFISLLPEKRLENTRVEELKGVAYIGFYEDEAKILIGAKDPQQIIKPSMLSSRPEINVNSGYTDEGNLAISIMSVFTPSYKHSRQRIIVSTVFNHPLPDEPARIVDELYHRRFILYDQFTKIALLCPLVNLLIFLVRHQLRKNHYRHERLRQLAVEINQNQCEIRNLQKVVIDEETDNEYTYGMVFKTMANRYTDTFTKLPAPQKYTGNMLKGKKIRGFDLADLVDNGNNGCVRELDVKDGIKAWGSLAKRIDVVFCWGIGDLVTIPEKEIICEKAPPLRCNVLICPIRSLRVYFADDPNCGYRESGNGKSRWVPTKDHPFQCRSTEQPCRPFECWATRLQEITDRPLNDQDWPDWTKELDRTGVICFGKMPTHHA